MNSLTQRSKTLADRRAVVADRTSKLKTQLFELERLRERLGQALRSPEKLSQPNRRKERRDGKFVDM